MVALSLCNSQPNEPLTDGISLLPKDLPFFAGTGYAFMNHIVDSFAAFLVCLELWFYCCWCCCFYDVVFLYIALILKDVLNLWRLGGAKCF